MNDFKFQVSNFKLTERLSDQGLPAIFHNLQGSTLLL